MSVTDATAIAQPDPGRVAAGIRQARSTPPPAVPPGTILFHAGFHKTGTTALQSALASSREALLETGVRYPGDLRSHHRAAMAVTERTWGWGKRGGRPPRATYWNDLREETRDHQGRVVISSEAFSLAGGDTVGRIVEELGADRLHAVFTLRPFAKLLASSYQQYLKYGLAVGYADWLQAVFANPPKCPPSPNFWKRNDHAKVIKRWSDLLGADRVTLVVVDDHDRSMLFRTFEGLLGADPGLLVPDPSISAGNRSMTAAEAELLRRVNAGGANTWDWPDYQNGIRRGAVMRMVEARRPGPDEPMLATPAWAVQAAQEFGASTAARVADLGVRIIGDLASLSDGIPAGEPTTEGVLLPVEAAVEAVLGGVLGVMADRVSQGDVKRRLTDGKQAAVDQAKQDVLAEIGTREAAALLRARVRSAARRRIGPKRKRAASRARTGAAS